jgi:ABC-type sugar transport system substrate-binding protein
MRMKSKRMRLIGASLAVAVAGAGLTACGGSDSASSASTSGGKKEVRIAFITLQQSVPYIASTIQGVRDEASKDGNAKLAQVFDAGFDAAKQYQQCSNAIASQKYDAFVVIPVDQSLVPCMEQAIKNGIKVVNTDFPMGPDPTSSKPQLEGQTGTIVDPVSERARWHGDLIKGACAQLKANPCKFALLAGSLTDQYSQTMNKMIKDNIKGQPIELTVLRAANFDRAEGYKVTQNILQANRDLDVIMSTSDPMTEGAEQAVEAAGLKGKVLLIGGGLNKAGYQAVKDGTWYGTTLSQPRLEGELGAKLAIRAARGENVSEGVSAVGQTGLDGVITKDDIAVLDKKGLGPQW